MFITFSTGTVESPVVYVDEEVSIRSTNSIRCDCPFSCSFKFRNGWYISDQFHPSHNHPISLCCATKQNIWSIQMRERVSTLINLDLSTASIVSLIDLEYPDPTKQRTEDDLRHFISRTRYPDTFDADTIVMQLTADPDNMVCYQITENQRLRSILVIYPEQKLLLAKYGDVLLIDATYKSNRYHITLSNI